MFLPWNISYFTRNLIPDNLFTATFVQVSNNPLITSYIIIIIIVIEPDTIYYNN